MRKFVWILGCALLCVAGGPVAAQTVLDNDLSRGWELRAGFFIPERETPRALEGDVWLTLGAERAFYEIERWRGTISIDYYGSGKIYNVPIMVNARGETQRLRDRQQQSEDQRELTDFRRHGLCAPLPLRRVVARRSGPGNARVSI